MFVTKKEFNKRIEAINKSAVSHADKIVALGDKDYVLEKRSAIATKNSFDSLSEKLEASRAENACAASEMKEDLLEKISSLECELIAFKHEKNISDKAVDLLTKIVCHLSGAKAYDGKRDFSFDELSRRLAKLEGREDENG